AALLVGTLAWFALIAALRRRAPAKAMWSLLAGAVAIRVEVRVAHRPVVPLDAFEPIVFAPVVYEVLFVVPFGIAAFAGFTNPAIPSADLTGGGLAVIAGVLSFAGGYFLLLPRPLDWKPDDRKPRPVRWVGRRTLWAIVVLLCGLSISSYVFFYFPLAGGVGAYIDPKGSFVGNVSFFRGTGIPRAVSVLASVGFFLACAHLFSRERPRKSDWALVGVAALVSVVTTALTKERVFVVWALAIPIVILHYGRRSIRIRE